jgi:hypothetical protein
MDTKAQQMMSSDVANLVSKLLCMCFQTMKMLSCLEALKPTSRVHVRLTYTVNLYELQMGVPYRFRAKCALQSLLT